jgi:6-pyruvoyltetrahydropterin/6-carboxytetrahydropterin synthase
MYFSTKKFGPISTGHRQPLAAETRNSARCMWAHGYGRIIKIDFVAKSLDVRGWVVDFGGLKKVKGWIEDQWDHRLLLTDQDPLLSKFQELHDMGGVNINIMDSSKGWGPGIEQSCKFLFDNINSMIQNLTSNRCEVYKIEVWEHELNSAYYINPKYLNLGDLND